MDGGLSEEQRQILEMARAFAAAEIAPHALDWDARKHFPRDVLAQAAQLGLAAIYCDPAQGGSGLGRLDATLVFEALAAACPATSAFLSIHNMATWMIDRFGDDALRERYVPRLATFELCASYCLTEPGAGSDAASLQTSARRDGDAYVLNGAKAFISGAGASDVYVVMARTGDAGARGVSTFVVDKDAAGLSFGAQEQKMGWNCQPTAQVLFDDVRVPAENRVGAEGEGFRIAMAGLDGGRLNIAACSLGAAQAALDQTVAYVKERRQFGQPLADFQATRFRLADMATQLTAARLLLRAAAAELDAKAATATQSCAMAKRFVTDAGWGVVDDAIQLHGGYGYIRDYGLEKRARDLRVHRILEGANEIMKVIIARALLK